MKKIVVLIGFLIQLLVLLSGIGILFLAVKGDPQKVKGFVELFFELSLPAVALGVLLLLLPIVYSLAKLTVGGKAKANIYFENTEGKVSISHAAITDFVDRICSNYDEVSHSVSKVNSETKKKGDVIVTIDMDILGGTNIPETVEKLQQNIKRQLSELLGLENIESVEINISKILSPEKEVVQEF